MVFTPPPASGSSGRSTRRQHPRDLLAPAFRLQQALLDVGLLSTCEVDEHGVQHWRLVGPDPAGRRVFDVYLDHCCAEVRICHEVADVPRLTDHAAERLARMPVIATPCASRAAVLMEARVSADDLSTAVLRTVLFNLEQAAACAR